MDWLKINGGPEPVLPGLKFTNKQLFFIGYAQVSRTFNVLIIKADFYRVS